MPHRLRRNSEHAIGALHDLATNAQPTDFRMHLDSARALDLVTLTHGDIDTGTPNLPCQESDRTRCRTGAWIFERLASCDEHTHMDIVRVQSSHRAEGDASELARDGLDR